MMETPMVKSARGHVEWLTECVERQEARIESGEHPLSEGETRRLLVYYQGRLDEWRKTLERSEREARETRSVD